MFRSSFQIPIPSVPVFQPSTPIPERLEAVQRYIRELQYPLLLPYWCDNTGRKSKRTFSVTNRKASPVVAGGELKLVP